MSSTHPLRRTSLHPRGDGDRNLKPSPLRPMVAIVLTSHEGWGDELPNA